MLASLKQYYLSKVWIFVAVMAHTFILSCYVFTSASGFHYYYLLLPTCLFLLFEEQHKYEKPILMALGLVLFFICENYVTPQPLIQLSDAQNKMIFSSTLLVVLLEIYLVTYVFSKAVNRNEDQLLTKASKDPLTGLNNRRSFIEIGQQLLNSAKRYDTPLSLVILDIDFFKQVNDQHGHLTGDKVLRQLSQWLNQGLRNSDVVARYGGEEFVVLLPATSAAAAQKLANSLREQVQRRELLSEQGEAFRISISAGVAQLESAETQLDQLMQRADAALYQAKHAGRNAVHLA